MAHVFRRHRPLILAASTLPAGKEAAKAAMAAVAAHREEFEFTSHCGGPNMDATPKDIIARVEAYSGLQLADAFAIPNLDREVKWHCKYARQNGIHASPTFMIDGLVDLSHEQRRCCIRLGFTFVGHVAGEYDADTRQSARRPRHRSSYGRSSWRDSYAFVSVSGFRKAASPASETSTHFGSGDASAA